MQHTYSKNIRYDFLPLEANFECKHLLKYCWWNRPLLYNENLKKSNFFVYSSFFLSFLLSVVNRVQLWRRLSRVWQRSRPDKLLRNFRLRFSYRRSGIPYRPTGSYAEPSSAFLISVVFITTTITWTFSLKLLNSFFQNSSQTNYGRLFRFTRALLQKGKVKKTFIH